MLTIFHVQISFAKMDDEALASVMPQIEAVAAG